MEKKLLSCFIHNFGVDPLQHSLQQQNSVIDQQIAGIQFLLNQIPLQVITKYIRVHDQTLGHLFLRNTKNKVDMLQQLYYIFSKNQVCKAKCTRLIQQVYNIRDFIQKFSIYQFLQVQNRQYTEKQSNKIKQLVVQLSQQIVTSQKINNQKNQHQCTDKHCKFSTLFLQNLREVMASIHLQMALSIFQISQNSITINSLCYVYLWREQHKIILRLIDKIEQFFQKLISYQVNDKLYYFKVYVLVLSGNSFGIKQQSQLVFQSTQVSLHYEVIKQSLIQFSQFFNLLAKTESSGSSQLVSDLRNKICNKVKQYFQYLIPYLNLNSRKQLIDILFRQSQESDLTIYQLLANLKLTARDVGSLIDIIKRIAHKLAQNPDSFVTVLKFIQMAKQRKKNLNMVFFLSDQLMEELESVQEVSVDVAEHIKQLLEIKEAIRGQIHQGPDIGQ